MLTLILTLNLTLTLTLTLDATPSLLEPMPEGRTCADAGIPDQYCACRNPEAQRRFSAVVEAAHSGARRLVNGGVAPASVDAAAGRPAKAKAAGKARSTSRERSRRRSSHVPRP